MQLAGPEDVYAFFFAGQLAGDVHGFPFAGPAGGEMSVDSFLWAGTCIAIFRDVGRREACMDPYFCPRKIMLARWNAGKLDSSFLK